MPLKLKPTKKIWLICFKTLTKKALAKRRSRRYLSAGPISEHESFFVMPSCALLAEDLQKKNLF